VIGLLILPWPFLTRLLRMKRKAFIILAAVFLLLVVGGVVLSSLLAKEAAFQRLTNASEVSASFDGRIAAYQQYLNTVP
jgi:O-antigen ligase